MGLFWLLACLSSLKCLRVDKVREETHMLPIWVQDVEHQSFFSGMSRDEWSGSSCTAAAQALVRPKLWHKCSSFNSQ